jgi:hypothetical protein
MSFSREEAIRLSISSFTLRPTTTLLNLAFYFRSQAVSVVGGTVALFNRNQIFAPARITTA